MGQAMPVKGGSVFFVFLQIQVTTLSASYSKKLNMEVNDG